MKSFRTELENKLVQKDIIDLEKMIYRHQNGQMDEEKFRSLRLARGVYGQRQPGVQMIRIKVPLGKLNWRQFHRILDVCDQYSTGKIHLTTRQDIQIHYVRLTDTPALWTELEKDEVTLREACGNTVRNVTASPMAGIDPDEPFSIEPHAQALFQYFLRNPVCQEMGRKFKIAFSSSQKDSAYAFMHDLGFVPTIRQGHQGFEVWIAGGLGAQPIKAERIFDFLPSNQLIPFTEATLRIFDRYGERTKRFKARFKYLYADLGKERFLELIELEKRSIPFKTLEIDTTRPELTEPTDHYTAEPEHSINYQKWLKLNTFEQKDSPRLAVGVRIPLGDLSTDICRSLIKIMSLVAVDDIRITQGQDFLFRGIEKENLPFVFNGLAQLGLNDIGFDSLTDITACPGTDTCNLAITNSTHVAREIEEVIEEEFEDLLDDSSLRIKISGCMNSCGQHAIVAIGLHGSSIKQGEKVIPAMQILLGGGYVNGTFQFSERVIKIPSKRILNAIRKILIDYQLNDSAHSGFAHYFNKQGKKYFYDMLKPFGNLEGASPSLFTDWGQSENYQPEIGVGECAGVVIDLVQTLWTEAEEKLQSALQSLADNQPDFSIYHSYSALICAAKAALVKKDEPTNTYHGIMNDFNTHFGSKLVKEIEPYKSFRQFVLHYQDHELNTEFATQYTLRSQTLISALQNHLT